MAEIVKLKKDGVTQYPITKPECVIDENGKNVLDLLRENGGGSPAPMTSVTYAELVTLRDNGELIAGMQYRIIDYVTTIAYFDIQSAGHQFDIIVTADDKNTLNEAVRVCLHDGDEYFASNNLNAWQIWYTIDNDDSRFEWASIKGKGVIYRMIDEFGNDCPYDFKNIMFNGIDPLNTDEYYYTFNCVENGINSDATVGYWEPEYTFTWDNEVSNNVVLASNDGGRFYLPKNIFYSSNIRRYTRFRNNFFSYNCEKNVLYNDCDNNYFSTNCCVNILDFNCSYNFFGIGCYGNSFGDHCSYNSFGIGCKYNSVGRYCDYNSFGNHCIHNSFRDDCTSNSFGNDCRYNSFRISASETATLLDACCYNHFDDGCSYNIIWHNAQPMYSKELKNINVVRGVSGEQNAYNFVNIVNRNANHEIKVAKNSNGEIKIYCEADLL